MSEVVSQNSSLVLDSPIPSQEPAPSLLSTRQRELVTLLEAFTGFALIMATVWTVKEAQRWLFWISAAWFLVWTLAAAWKKGRRGLRLPSPKVAGTLIVAAILVAGGVMALAAAVGTLHGLFGTRAPLRHASSYLLWAIIQQTIQQTFFLPRFEQVTQRGLMASFLTALLFGVAHLPNPVLTPVTFVGGWVLSELFRRYRSVLPLGIAHGVVGMAIAVSVPDHIQHHMRVGVSYLLYMH